MDTFDHDQFYINPSATTDANMDSTSVYGLASADLPPVSEDDIERALLVLQMEKNDLIKKRKVANRKLADETNTYGRTSVNPREFAVSKERQDEDADAAVLKFGLPPIADRYFDHGIRGVTWEQRKGLMALIAKLSNPKSYGCVLFVEDIDRMLRDEGVLFRIGPILRQNGIRVYDRNGLVDAPRLLEAAARAVAAYRLLCERSLRARRSSMKKGRIHGGIPFGYEYSGRARIRPNANREVVNTIYEMRTRGEDTGTIARYLQSIDAPRPGTAEWSTTSVLAILKREIYTGWVVYKCGDGEEYRTFNPDLIIVQKEVWERAQVINILNARDKSSPMVSKGAKEPMLLSGQCECSDCGEKAHAAYQSAKGRHLVCSNHVRSGNCVSVAFPYDRTEARVLIKMRDVLRDQVYEEAFQRELVDGIRSRALEIEAKRVEKAAELIRERQRYDKNRQMAYDASEMHNYRDLLEKNLVRIAELEGEISNMRTPNYASFAEGDLPTLRDSIDAYIAAGPFKAVTPQDEQVRRIIQAIVSTVKLEVTSDTGRRQRTILDFGAAVGVKDPMLVFQDVYDYEDDPKLIKFEQRTRIAGMLKQADWALDAARAGALSDHVVIKAYFGTLPADRLQRFLSLVCLAATHDLPLKTTVDLDGFRNSAYWKAFNKLRKSAVALQQFVDVVSETCGTKVHAFFGKLRTKKKPLERMLEVDHPLLQHPICQKEGFAMSEDQWKIVRCKLTSIEASPRAAERLITARFDLDRLFAAVRANVTMVAVAGKHGAGNTNRRLTELQASGDFERITHALLKDAGLDLGNQPVPFF
ncbi:recombinase family protein [Devosia sediminis]|uniref:Recombinase family protein n=1 Tax=Devosia sediminis TaxID=2798801 RepID=A0A934J276_9HYPH|nr:recombinase family protein [Devosia sediminis]MBJ3786395.1 recombinase family protein [Devosia sediminis]